MSKKTLFLTYGEPAGIGPDVLLQLGQTMPSAQQPWQIAGDVDFLAERARILQLDFPLKHTDITEIKLPKKVILGEPNPKNARAILDTLDAGIAACMDKTAHALVTAPLQKSVINDAGILFSGHTEYLAEKIDENYPQFKKNPNISLLPVMMLASPALRVALVTTHLPLRAVADAITPQLFENILNILYENLIHKFDIKQPEIWVAGLNPHAGEGGHLGTEERDILNPIIQKWRNQSKNIRGCLPADTLFGLPELARADAVLAMYHDQGLAPLKMQGFGEIVNITLGLPMIRTSVDHGTALDLAGTGRAHTGSLRAAIDMAARLKNGL